MAIAAAALRAATPEEYRAYDRADAYKSEYVGGCIRPMPPVNLAHNLITGNIAAHLHACTRRGPCEVYASRMRVKVTATGAYLYPDVTGQCAGPVLEPDHDADSLLNPALIIEVLSPATEAYDRGEKFAQYRRLPSLQEYVLVAQDRVYVEHYARRDRGWLLTEVRDLDATLEMPAVGCALPLREVYDGVAPFAAEPPAR